MNLNSVTGLLWLIGFGAVFYFMMRAGGCGMHGRHSDAGGHHHDDAEEGRGGAGAHSGHTMAQVRDPVCGMQIEPGDAAGTRTVGGRTFYLCSADCLAKFDRAPETYARRAPTDEARPAQGAHRHHAGC